MHISIITLQSIDGFLARSKNDDLSWGSRADKDFFISKTKAVGTMIMGSTTFEAMKGTKGFAFKDRNIIVMTSRPEAYSDYRNEFAKKIEFISGIPKDIVKHLEKLGINDAVVIGGGKIIQQFLSSDLVDELFITIAPVIFGKGISACDGEIKNLKLTLENKAEISTNEILLHYKVVH